MAVERELIFAVTCRYTGRGPLASERLSQRSDGRLAYRIKRPWSNVTTQIILDPLQLIEKLAACEGAARGWFAALATEPGLGAEPRFAWTRHPGFISYAITVCWRRRRNGASRSFLCRPTPKPPMRCVPTIRRRAARRTIGSTAPQLHHLIHGSQLMRRAFAIDVLESPQCQAP